MTSVHIQQTYTGIFHENYFKIHKNVRENWEFFHENLDFSREN